MPDNEFWELDKLFNEDEIDQAQRGLNEGEIDIQPSVAMGNTDEFACLACLARPMTVTNSNYLQF